MPASVSLPANSSVKRDPHDSGQIPLLGIPLGSFTFYADPAAPTSEPVFNETFPDTSTDLFWGCYSIIVIWFTILYITTFCLRHCVHRRLPLYNFFPAVITTSADWLPGLCNQYIRDLRASWLKRWEFSFHFHLGARWFWYLWCFRCRLSSCWEMGAVLGHVWIWNVSTRKNHTQAYEVCSISGEHICSGTYRSSHKHTVWFLSAESISIPEVRTANGSGNCRRNPAAGMSSPDKFWNSLNTDKHTPWRYSYYHHPALSTYHLQNRAFAILRISEITGSFATDMDRQHRSCTKREGEQAEQQAIIQFNSDSIIFSPLPKYCDG